MTELILFGILTGFISGFFGVGGGMVLVPMLITTGFVMKEAIAISIMQMVFSSVYGSFLNSKKKQKVFLKMESSLEWVVLLEVFKTVLFMLLYQMNFYNTFLF